MYSTIGIDCHTSELSGRLRRTGVWLTGLALGRQRLLCACSTSRYEHCTIRCVVLRSKTDREDIDNCCASGQGCSYLFSLLPIVGLQGTWAM